MYEMSGAYVGAVFLSFSYFLYKRDLCIYFI